MNLKALIMIKSFNSCIKEAEKLGHYDKCENKIYGIEKKYWRSSYSTFHYPSFAVRSIFRNGDSILL